MEQDNKQNGQQGEPGQPGQVTSPVDGTTAFKINKPLHEKIAVYLNKRPFAEVDAMLTEVFEADYEATFITEDGMQQIVNYLMKCPRKEVKELMTEISQPSSLVKYTVKNKNVGNTSSDIPETEQLNDTPETEQQGGDKSLVD